MKRISPQDSIFLLGESGRTMMHVAALLRFSAPPDRSRDHLRTMVEEVRESTVQQPWNRKLRHPAGLTTPWQAWVVDDEVDLDYHVRRSALPSPGDERELGILVSRLHSRQLDLSRPPWELHVIEGLEDGGFAVYVKMHHGLVDGYTGMRLLQRSLTVDPDDRDAPMIFAVPPKERPPRASLLPPPSGNVLGRLRGKVATTYQVGSRLGHLVRRGDDEHLVGPAQAPRTTINRRIGRNRRFATQQYDLAEMRELGQRAGATLNDVCISVLGGGLRRYLAEVDELPEKPLIAFVPVNVRPEGDEGGGNAVGAILATMGTDVADPVARLAAVAASTRAGKAQLQGMSQGAMIAYSLGLLSPLAVQTTLAATGLTSTRLGSPAPLAFNVIVSNVPGPKETRWFRGSRLEAMHPVSIPLHGVGLNVTFMGYADTLNFGFVGDRDTVPHLQRLAVHTGEALDELRAAMAER